MLSAFIVFGAASELADTSPEEVIEEVVIKTVLRCGSWPINHMSVSGCEYAKLKREALPAVVKQRPKLLARCLNCRDRQCVVRQWSDYQVTERRLCKTLFWTPIQVSSYLYAAKFATQIKVSYTYSISTRGRIEDIAITSFESDMTKQEVLNIVTRGAARVRFEPLNIAGAEYELVGLRDAIILGYQF